MSEPVPAEHGGSARDRALAEPGCVPGGPGGQARTDPGMLAGLRRSGEIDERHISSADRWYRDWVMGIEGARDPEHPGSGKAGDRHAGMLARIKASSRCAAVRHALGPSAEMRLRLTMIDGLSFSEIGRRLMPGDANARKKIAAQTALLLEMLSEHYDLTDRRAKGPAHPISSTK